MFNLYNMVKMANLFNERAKILRDFPALYTSLADRYERASEYLIRRIYRV